MNTSLSFRPIALTLLVLFVVSYLLCIFAGLLFGWQMIDIWAPLLPGFAWPLTRFGFFIGLLWLIIYSLYGAALIVFPYNYFTDRSKV